MASSVRPLPLNKDPVGSLDAYQDAQTIKAGVGAHKEFLKQRALVKSNIDWSDRDLQDLAMSRVQSNTALTTREQQIAAARQYYAELKQHQEKLKAAAPIAEQRALEQGAGQLPPLLQVETQGGASTTPTVDTQPQHKRSFLEKAVVDPLSMPWRALSGTAMGAVEAAREGTKDIPITSTPNPDYDPNRQEIRASRTGMGGLLLQGPGAPTIPDKARLAGISPTDLAKRVLEKPSLLVDMVTTAAKRGATAFTQPFTGTPSIDAVTKYLDETYKDRATDFALNLPEDQGLTREDRLRIARDKYNEYVETDMASWALKHPELTDFVLGVPLDPLNLAGGYIAKGVGHAWKALLQTARDAGIVKTPVGMAALKTMASPHAQELHDVMNQALMKGEHATEIPLRNLSTGVDELERLLPVHERESVMQAFEAGATPTTPRQAKQFELLAKMQSEHAPLHELTGKQWDETEGALLAPKWRKKYVPHGLKEPTLGTDAARIPDPNAMNTVDPASAKSRIKEEASILDPVEQWRAEQGRQAMVAGPASQMRALQEAAQKTDFIVEVPMHEPEAIGSLQAAKELETGIPWVVMEPEAHAKELEIFQRVTGGVGTRVGETAILMPKPLQEEIVRLMTPIGQEAKATKAARSEMTQFLVSGLSTLHNYTTRPLTNIFTQSVKFVPAYHANNAGGAFTIVTAGLGARAFDPALQAGGIALAGLAKFDDAALAGMSFAARNGESRSLLEAKKILTEIGWMDEEALAFGKGTRSRSSRLFGRKIPNPMGMLEQATHKIGDLTLVNQTNDAIERYQKTANFLGFLDDWSPKGVAKAVRLTEEFAGNYKKMTKFEHNVMRELVPFYAWTRFVLPWGIKRMVDRPQVMANWLKYKGYLDKTGTQVNKDLLTKWQRDHIGAPAAAQPPEQEGDLAPDVATSKIQDPITMAFELVPMVAAMLGGEKVERGGIANQMSGIAFQMLIEMMTGKDMDTDEPLPPLIGLQSTQDFKSSQIPKALGKALSRPSQAFTDLLKLYMDNGDLERAGMLALQYKVGRDFLGADNWVAWLLKKQGRSRGGMLDTGHFGSQTYLSNPTKEAVRQSKEGLETYKRDTKRLTQ